MSKSSSQITCWTELVFPANSFPDGESEAFKVDYHFYLSVYLLTWTLTSRKRASGPFQLVFSFCCLDSSSHLQMCEFSINFSVTQSSKSDLFSSVIPHFSSLPLSSSNCENKLNLIIIVFMLWSGVSKALIYLKESVCFTTKCFGFMFLQLQSETFGFFLFAFYCVNP